MPLIRKAVITELVKNWFLFVTRYDESSFLGVDVCHFQGWTVDHPRGRHSQLVVEFRRKHGLIVILVHHVFHVSPVVLDSLDLCLNRMRSILDGVSGAIGDC